MSPDPNDPGSNHTPDVLIDVVIDALSQTCSIWRRRALMNARKIFTGALANGHENILEELKFLLFEFGYDGLMYRLNYESPGALAAIILDGRQVRSAFNQNEYFSNTDRRSISCRTLCPGTSTVWLSDLVP